jgi:hypothetical protein
MKLLFYFDVLYTIINEESGGKKKRETKYIKSKIKQIKKNK